VTGEDGKVKFENLPYGTYYYQETKAPEGYELDGKKVEFKVTEDGKVITETITNKKIIPEVILGKLQIIKIDSEDRNTLLKDAEFNILDELGNIVATGITDENGIAEFDQLKAGVYYYQEIKAPEGYEIINGEKIKFEIKENGELITVIVENKKVEEPTEPEDPKDPVNPEDPTEPEDPKDPVNPEDPTNPEEPKDPVSPEEPINPEEPSEQEKPINPEQDKTEKPGINGDNNVPGTGEKGMLGYFLIMFTALAGLYVVNKKIS
ncbi:MAG: SpaA isopeptide-forming pilin-related protein, partial [Sarcina sp.]